MEATHKTTTATILVLLVTVPVFPLHAQTPPAKQRKNSARVPSAQKDGPASAELRALVQGDQDDRSFYFKQKALSPREAVRAAAADDKRLARARVLLGQNKLVTAEDFENAALLFQHGRTPDDFLVAHELSVVSLLKARQNRADTMPVLTEDRFLERIGRKQRFGSQSNTVTDTRSGKISRKLSDVDEDGNLAVTDTLRADLFMPPLSFSQKQQLTPPPEVIGPLIARIRQRYNPEWQAEQERRPEAQELEHLAEGEPTQANVARVLSLYRDDNLRTPADYANAATVLLNAAKAMSTGQESRQASSRQLLLAHELAMVATLRKHPNGPTLFAQTWDRFLVSAGQLQRYGTYKEQRGDRMVYVGGYSGPTNATIKALFGEKAPSTF